MIEKKFDVEKLKLLKLAIWSDLFLFIGTRSNSGYLTDALEGTVQVKGDQRLFHLPEQPLPVVCHGVRFSHSRQEWKVTLAHVVLELPNFLVIACHSEEAQRLYVLKLRFEVASKEPEYKRRFCSILLRASPPELIQEFPKNVKCSLISFCWALLRAFCLN